jgi:Carboxypeptidase regulatory-like domain
MFMRRRFQIVLAMLAVALLASAPAFAQGGGASTTGSINGKVADSSGGVLPGVTVTATSASLMGVQTSVSDTGGLYRFPALPPGTYTLTYELPGFNTLKRENIQIAMAFTATVNVELAVASLNETVTVTGDSPVIDTTSTRVQQNFKLEALQEIPNSRDLWSLLAVTPGVTMDRLDVGGDRAGTQSGYTAYGYSGQNRVLVEGINTTEGTSGAGFYVDYGSFEEVFLGTIGQGAEMPTPGVQSQMLGKSGGNKFQGEIYQDFENNHLQSGNIPSDVLAKGIREHSNELQAYHDFNINVGGPIKQDKVWWYFSYRNQTTGVGQPNFVDAIAGKTFNTNLWNPSGKTTYQINQNNKLIGYYQWGQKNQPNRLPQSTFTYDTLDKTLFQASGSWIYKGEWNGTVNKNMYVEARYGVFGYYFPLTANSDSQLFEIFDTGLAKITQGADQKEQTDRQRRQLTGSATYFKDGWAGSHSFKVGAEMLLETGWYGSTQVASGNVRENFNSGVPQTVILYAPTATHVGSLGDGPNGNLLSVDKLNTYDAFISDQWSVGRATFNLGARYDRYRNWTPEQRQLAYAFGPLNVAAQTFGEQTYATWNKIVPRLGMTYDLMGDGKTVVKVNYGLFGFNPGVGVSANGNPNQATKSVTYSWKDAGGCAGCIAGDGIYQAGEEGGITANSLSNAVSVDPGLFQPTSTQATAYLERQLTEGVGARLGFVYFKVKDQVATFQPFRPASAYTVPFTVIDKGPDNVQGTSDDQSLTFRGIPTAALGNFPATQVVTNTPNNGSYKTFEVSVNKRQSHNYSVGGGVGYTWSNDYPLSFPNTPNGPGCVSGDSFTAPCDYTRWSAKVNASYNAPWGITVSPVFRFQNGQNYARTLGVTAPASCNCTFSAARGSSLSNTTVYVTSYNALRQENVGDLDVRVEKTVNFGHYAKVRLFFDGYNLTNAYAAQTISQATGASFLNPTAILAPRTGRLGFRFMW